GAIHENARLSHTRFGSIHSRNHLLDIAEGGNDRQRGIDWSARGRYSRPDQKCAKPAGGRLSGPLTSRVLGPVSGSQKGLRCLESTAAALPRRARPTSKTFFPNP